VVEVEVEVEVEEEVGEAVVMMVGEAKSCRACEAMYSSQSNKPTSCTYNRPAKRFVSPAAAAITTTTA